MAWGFADIETLKTQVVGAEDDLTTTIGNVKNTQTPSTADLLDLQMRMQKWGLLVDLQATLCKTLAETMKGVIQKSG